MCAKLLDFLLSFADSGFESWQRQSRRVEFTLQVIRLPLEAQNVDIRNGPVFRERTRYR